MRGACLCGAVAFEADLPLRRMIACHCTQCRKQSGHFWVATSVPHPAFRLTRNEGLAWYRASLAATRGFCRRCGSFLFWQAEGEAEISIAGGALEGAIGLKIAESWFHEDAGDYYDPAGGPPPEPVSAGGRPAGSCLCGANHFTLPGPVGEVTACHCTQCRKSSGHYSASFDAAEATLDWRARHLAEYVTPGGGQRGFCPDCGSSLYFRAADGSFSVEAGAIDAPGGGRLCAHIFVADKGDYYDLTDGLPQYPGWD